MQISNDELRTKVDQCNTDIIRLQTELQVYWFCWSCACHVYYCGMQDNADKYEEELHLMKTEVQQKNAQLEKLEVQQKPQYDNRTTENTIELL